MIVVDVHAAKERVAVQKCATDTEVPIFFPEGIDCTVDLLPVIPLAVLGIEG